MLVMALAAVLRFEGDGDALTTFDLNQQEEEEETPIYEKHDNMLHGDRSKRYAAAAAFCACACVCVWLCVRACGAEGQWRGFNALCWPSSSMCEMHLITRRLFDSGHNNAVQRCVLQGEDCLC